jgi:hypothetical protein
MQIFGVVVNPDDTVRVIARDVVKETYSERIVKADARTSARAALEHYMARRQRQKADAQAVVAQATRQIASANELLMREPEPVTT